eukprot:TRINITY_DN20702_c0_g1_i1.p1 TRINITY_DN20702_c0_g1~~TRINITY_DN20702_c0_g1_i1.p1  ORF type:complete len:237 (+),score=55.54 TRINITY_DN20702_c0_g1_i1:512-1222(+)
MTPNHDWRHTTDSSSSSSPYVNDLNMNSFLPTMESFPSIAHNHNNNNMVNISTNNNIVNQANNLVDYTFPLEWVEPPPQKVVQHKQFTFSFLLSTPNHIDITNLFGTSTFDIFQVSLQEENKDFVSNNKFSLVIQKQDGPTPNLFKVFMKIRKNSHYGRTRFIIKIQMKDVPKEVCTQEGINNIVSGVVTSEPIVVISKVRTKRKRESDKDSEMDVLQITKQEEPSVKRQKTNEDA